MDNCSTDRSATYARRAGATVLPVLRKGKGNVVREIFRRIDADIYVMVDGDDTYPAEAVRDLLSGGRYAAENKRSFHTFGNDLVCRLVNAAFGSTMKDIMSGYRVFSRRFTQVVPILSDGFEVETEMTIAALDRKLPLVEIPVAYRDRPAGSHSKLHTFRDGFRVLKTIFIVVKDYRPLFFFGALSLVAFVVGLASGLPVIFEFLKTRYITLVPSAIFATGCTLLAATLLSCGLILDSVSKYHRERNEMDVVRKWSTLR
jgi:glycosyltransferase involved in cell wall biosynthesis